MAKSNNFLIDAFYSLARNINKPRYEESQKDTQEGVVGTFLPELKLDTSNDELITLSNKWESIWNDSSVKTKWLERGQENENYWKGQQFERAAVEKSRAMVDNVIFESLETYLPGVTRRNPEPMVSLPVGVEQTSVNQEYAHALQLELGEIADDIKLRLKLKGAARNKEMYLLGAVKLSWDIDRDGPQVKVIRPQKLILDPEAVTDEDGYSGDRIGEHRKLTGARLVELTADEPDAAEVAVFITAECKNAMGTELAFIEWWTPNYYFWKLGNRVLKKRKNPHWNYDEQPVNDQPEAVVDENPAMPQGMPALAAPQPVPTPAEQNPAMPAGMPTAPEIAPAAPSQPRKAVNHFRTRKVPYILLSTYNLGKQPVDDTSLMGQNLAMQDVVNKRNKQIDNNADDMNNGMVVSLARSGLSQTQAKGVTSALRKRGVVAIPDGNPQEAVWKPPTPGLPVDVYNDLNDKRMRIRGVFGVTSMMPSGLQEEKTVRGKLITKSADTDRIGGGIAEYLEQFSDDIYNWIVQLLYVYDDRFQEFMARGVEIPRVKVSVKEGSLIPKDATTIANQAMELAAGGKMSTIDLYKRLDYPNPEQLAADAWLEANAPEVLYADDPRVAQVIQQRQAAAAGQAKPPSESINFKDIPPEAQIQMLKQAGIDISPQELIDHLALKHAQEAAKKAPPPGAEGGGPAAPDLGGP